MKKDASTRREPEFIQQLKSRIAYTDDERLLILESIRDTSLEWLHGLVSDRDGKGTAAAQMCYEKAQESLDKLTSDGGARVGNLSLLINNVRLDDIQTGSGDG
ncbi:MAG: hypothetical protein GY832_23805 [Chloroflexi bacterium]|nr:hypothetical protein [Chloroflexota bacterium]